MAYNLKREDNLDKINKNQEIKKFREYQTKTPKEGKRGYAPIKGNDAEMFEEYFRCRSMNKVAQKFGVSWIGVKVHAKNKKWRQRIKELEEKTEKKIQETISDKMAQDAGRLYDNMTLAQKNAVNLLSKPDLENGKHVKPREMMVATTVLDMVIKSKRLLAGESTEKQEFTLKDFMMIAFKAKNKNGEQLEGEAAIPVKNQIVEAVTIPAEEKLQNV